MSAQAELLHCYQEWRRWSETERQAIASADWAALEAAQAQKTTLQAEILRWTTEATSCPNDRDSAQAECQIRAALQALIEFETRTAELIAQARAQANQEAQELDRMSLNLQRVRRSYGTSHAQVWSSYS